MKTILMLILISLMSCSDETSTNPKVEPVVKDVKFEFPLRISYIIANPKGNDNSNDVKEEFGIINLSDSIVSSRDWHILDDESTNWNLDDVFEIGKDTTFVYVSDKNSQLNNAGDEVSLYFGNRLIQRIKFGNQNDGDTIWVDIDLTTSIDTTNLVVPELLELPNTEIYNNLVYHNHYTLSYSTKFLQPNWVAYELLASEIDSKFDRLDNFINDPKLLFQQATDNDYLNSGFDKGHLLPADNCKFDSIAMKECFYYTNISPQYPEFNRGIWKTIENIERKLAVDYGRVWVLTCSSNFINPNKEDETYLSIPESFGKAFLIKDGDKYKGITFIVPHNKDVANEEDLTKFTYNMYDFEEHFLVDLYYQLDTETKVSFKNNKSLELIR